MFLAFIIIDHTNNVMYRWSSSISVKYSFVFLAPLVLADGNVEHFGPKQGILKTTVWIVMEFAVQDEPH